jgi:hypothetical protein
VADGYRLEQKQHAPRENAQAGVAFVNGAFWANQSAQDGQDGGAG